MKVLLAMVAIFGIYITCTAGQDGCVCAQIYQPVCGEDVQTYGNACEAGCANVAVAFEGECDCVCTQDYSPVCGANGITYSNDCFARCVSVAVSSTGECDATPDASNGDTSNGETSEESESRESRPRLGRRQGRRPGRVSGQRQREDRSLCSFCRSLLRGGLSTVLNQQACYDGVTYDNMCEAICQGGADNLREVKLGACPEPEGCVCAFIYQPVCGIDGQTYGNACQAGCEDVEVVSQGECPAV